MSKTIELIKSEIYEAKSNLLKFNQLLIENPKREGYSFYVTYFTNRLNILEQIKTELEAWEICKNKLNLKVQTEESVTEGFCMKGYWLLVEQYPYTQTTIIEQEEYEILKKALEKENV